MSVVFPLRQSDRWLFTRMLNWFLVLPTFVVEQLHPIHFRQYRTFLLLHVICSRIVHSSPLDVMKDVHSMTWCRHISHFLFWHFQSPFGLLLVSEEEKLARVSWRSKFGGCLVARVTFVLLKTSRTRSLQHSSRSFCAVFVTCRISQFGENVDTSVMLFLAGAGAGPCRNAFLNPLLMTLGSQLHFSRYSRSSSKRSFSVLGSEQKMWIFFASVKGMLSLTCFGCELWQSR